MAKLSRLYYIGSKLSQHMRAVDEFDRRSKFTRETTADAAESLDLLGTH